MSDPKSPDDLFDAPMPGMGIPTPPGMGETPVAPKPRDPSDVDDPPTSAAAPTVARDPAALARELAEKAKKKAQQAKPATDPAALARELVEKAKKKAQQAKPATDPAALARELAEKAKKKAQQTAPSAPPAAEERPIDIPPTKKRSAIEILAEAREREAQAKAVRERPAPAASKPAAAKPAAPASPLLDSAAAIAAVLPGATVHSTRVPSSDVALRAVWRAHLARAQAGGDAPLAVAASALLGALDRLGTRGLLVADVTFGDARHAVFIDATTGAAIATASPPEVYLAGS